MVKRLTILGGVCVVLLVLSQLLLPLAVSDGIARAVKGLVHTDQIEVKAEKFPAILMLGGDFDAIFLQAKNVQTERVTFDELMVRLEEVNLDVGKLWQAHDFSFHEVKNVELQAVVSEKELAALINKKIKGAKDAKVKITPEKVTAQSTLALGKMVNAAVVIEGKIIALDHRIVFTTEHFKIDNPVLGKLGGAIFTDLVLADFKELPFDVQVKKIVLEEGRVLIQADNRDSVR